MGHAMLGFPGKPIETNMPPPQRPTRKQTGTRSAQASATKSPSSSAASRALSASPVSRRSQTLAADQKYPRHTVHTFRDSIDSVRRSSGGVQLTPAVSAGHGALGAPTWGSAIPAAPIGVSTSVGATKGTTASSRTRHRREAGLSSSRERVGRASVNVPPSGATRTVEPPKRASHPQHPVKVAAPKVPVAFIKVPMAVPKVPVTVSNIPGSVRRPVSFVKALEVSDQLSVVDEQWKRDRPRQPGLSPQPEEELQNVLEISV